jgi:hypothetical protein
MRSAHGQGLFIFSAIAPRHALGGAQAAFAAHPCGWISAAWENGTFTLRL